MYTKRWNRGLESALFIVVLKTQLNNFEMELEN